MVWRVGAHTPYPLSLLSTWEETLIIEVQLKPSPTWPLLPYPRVSNAKYNPMKTPQYNASKYTREHPITTQNKTLQINPTYKQATNNNTTLYARTSMIKHGGNKIQSQESYLQQRVMVTMEVWEELPFSPSISNYLPTFSKSRDWVTTPKLLQKSTK